MCVFTLILEKRDSVERAVGDVAIPEEIVSDMEGVKHSHMSAEYGLIGRTGGASIQQTDVLYKTKRNCWITYLSAITANDRRDTATTE